MSSCPCSFFSLLSPSTSMSFVQLYEFMQQFFKPDSELLWLFCLRVKRGLKDQTCVGAYAKDQLCAHHTTCVVVRWGFNYTLLTQPSLCSTLPAILLAHTRS